MNRREFVKYMTAAGAMAAGSNWMLDRVWSMVEEGQIAGRLAEPPGLESWSSSICHLCPGGCGVKTRLIDGLPVGIHGNPLYPLNRGGLCATGNAGLQLLYNADRVPGPMKRVGEPGSGSWEPISWDEALALVADKLSELRRASHAHRMVFLDGGSRGLQEKIFRQFVRAYGSPNYIRTDDWDNRKSVFHFMQGYDDIPGIDLKNAQFVLSFGADLLENESSSVWFSGQLSAMRQRSGKPRGRLVQVAPRLSATAVKADKWAPVKVGSEGALALGLAYIIIQEELYDREFIATNTFGFENWTDESGVTHTGFKTLVLSDYYPEAVSRLTGSSIEDIVSLARKFAHSKTAVAIAGAGVAESRNGFYSQMAIHALNALVGSIDIPGGVVSLKGAPIGWPEAKVDEIARLSLSESRIDLGQTPKFPLARHISANLGEAIASEHPYRVEMMFLSKSNPLFENAGVAGLKQALSKIPFIVSFSPFFDESAEYAHLVLPDSHFLEGWQEDFGAPHVPFDYFGVGKPVVTSIADTRQTGDIVLSLAHALGGAVAASLPFASYSDTIKSAARNIYESGRGVVIQNEFDQNWVEYLETRGWRYPRHKSFDEFWRHLLSEGGWVDPVPPRVHKRHSFNTPSGKFEFFSLGMQKQLSEFATTEARAKHTSVEFALGSTVKAMGISARGDVLYLPHFEPPRFFGDESDYPFHLIPFGIDVIGDGQGTNAPMLMEMVGFRQYVRWNSWVEINPESAREIGVNDGDWVWVESVNDRLRCRARVFAGVQPNMINIPVGLGHTAMGRNAKNRGVNPATVTINDFDPLSGVSSQFGTRVKIYKRQSS